MSTTITYTEGASRAETAFPPTPPRSDKGESDSVHSVTTVLAEKRSAFGLSRSVLDALLLQFWPSFDHLGRVSPSRFNIFAKYNTLVEENEEEEADGSMDIPLPPPSTNPTEVLDIDAKTPDFHVSRDPRMVRLTGVHPFNVEAPLSTLFDQGMYHPLYKYVQYKN
jgi:hypothetical protein